MRYGIVSLVHFVNEAECVHCFPVRGLSLVAPLLRAT